MCRVIAGAASGKYKHFSLEEHFPYGVRRSATLFGDVSFPLSMEALGHAVGKDDDGPATLDASRRWCEGRLDAQNL